MTKPLSATELKRLHRDRRRHTDLRVSLILDGVQKPFNVGAILRSSAAYRAEHIWFVPPSATPIDAKVAKTALGCDRLLQWSEMDTGVTAVEAAKQLGFCTVAIELTTSAVPLFEIQLGRAVCLVVGHEERGVKQDTLRVVDHVGYLPQLGKVGSLNVAQATTVSLYEVARQRWMA